MWFNKNDENVVLCLVNRVATNGIHSEIWSFNFTKKVGLSLIPTHSQSIYCAKFMCAN